MNVIVLQSHKSLISSSFSKQIRLGDPVCPLNDGCLAFTSRKDVLNLSVSSANSDGGRPLRAGRREKKDESETSVSSDDKLLKSAKREKITALFRQIHSSISNAEAKRAKQAKDGLSETSPTESVKSQKPVKANATKRRKRNQVSLQKQTLPKKDDKTRKNTQHSAVSFKVTRPPSNFLKKSPIPTPSIPRGHPIKENNDVSAARDHGKVPMEEMKLPQLKELAKSRGIKGFCKLKKSKLLELLSA